MELKYEVKDNTYSSINQLLKIEFQISSRLLVRLINNNKVFLNGKPCDTRTKPQANDIIIVKLDAEEDNSNIEPKEMELDIVYEDEGLLIINKPAGLTVHPSLRHYNNSLSNGVKSYYNKIELNKKIRPVNRLDKDTSGLVIFAKNEYVQECLINQMKRGKFYKEYICIVEGVLDEKTGVINVPVARKEKSIIERCVREDGQNAITQYEVLKEYKNYSVVKCILKTGRTHQIRVHMAYIKHPLLGDTLYGNKSELIDRQALHCNKLAFINPVTNKYLELTNRLPKEMSQLFNY